MISDTRRTFNLSSDVILNFWNAFQRYSLRELIHCSFVERSTDDTLAHRDKVGHRIDLGIGQSESSITFRSLARTYTGIRSTNQKRRIRDTLSPLVGAMKMYKI